MTTRGDLGTIDSFELVEEILLDRQDTGETPSMADLEDLCISCDARLDIVGPLVVGPHLLPDWRLEEDKEMAQAINILETLHGRSFNQRVSSMPEPKGQ